MKVLFSGVARSVDRVQDPGLGPIALDGSPDNFVPVREYVGEATLLVGRTSGWLCPLRERVEEASPEYVMSGDQVMGDLVEDWADDTSVVSNARGAMIGMDQDNMLGLDKDGSDREEITPLAGGVAGPETCGGCLVEVRGLRSAVARLTEMVGFF